MAYKVLSLKWRPQTFEDVVGQEHVTQTLINAFKQDRIAQGYIFTSENIALCNPILLKSVNKGLSNMLLSNNILECLRSPF